MEQREDRYEDVCAYNIPMRSLSRRREIIERRGADCFWIPDSELFGRCSECKYHIKRVAERLSAGELLVFKEDLERELEWVSELLGKFIELKEP